MTVSIADRLRFDPATGTVIRTPPGSGYGYWVGGHKVTHQDGRFVLFCRERRPLEFGRGGSCSVAISEDGIDFETVWTADKSAFDASSLEVGHVVRHREDEWRLYISYERAGTTTWRIDVLQAADPAEFVAQSRRTVLQPQHFGIGWIKDPWVVRTDDGGYDLYAAVPARGAPSVDEDGISIGPEDATVLARSSDGLIFERLEYVYEAAMDGSWHGHRGRLDCLFPFEDGWVGTFSGGRTMYDNYEEPCGLVAGPDRHSLTRVDTAGPWVQSPYGCVRYVFGVPVGDAVYFYYEYTTEDGSHDLRVSVVRPG